MPHLSGAFGTLASAPPLEVRNIAMNHATATLVALLFWLASIVLRGAPEAMPVTAWFAACWGTIVVIVSGSLGSDLAQELRTFSAHSSHRV